MFPKSFPIHILEVPPWLYLHWRDLSQGAPLPLMSLGWRFKVSIRWSFHFGSRNFQLHHNNSCNSSPTFCNPQKNWALSKQNPGKLKIWTKKKEHKVHKREQKQPKSTHLGIPDTLLGLFQGCSHAFGHLTFQPNQRWQGRKGGVFQWLPRESRTQCQDHQTRRARPFQVIHLKRKGIFFMRQLCQKKRVWFGGRCFEAHCFLLFFWGFNLLVGWYFKTPPI